GQCLLLCGGSGLGALLGVPCDGVASRPSLQSAAPPNKDRQSQECHYSSEELKDIEFIYRFIFNKLEYARYNSTLNKYTGYTKHGVYNAKIWNENGETDKQHTNVDSYCRHNVFPVARRWRVVYSEKSGSQRHSTMLVCSAYNFYPEGIKLTWLRDGKEVKTDVTSTEELYDGDWYYQIHSYLELTPKSGETIACKVEHSSFSEPKVFKWGGSGVAGAVVVGAAAFGPKGYRFTFYLLLLHL
uniref:Ig-like domain-containing protein n=1 Tax=Scleropages formosus TaxID=113540 RepID=A0A8C9SKN2_SCLFO